MEPNEPFLPYQQPDRTWEIWESTKDYRNYIEEMVVKGKFHPLVPKHVVDSYLIAEHIMAHAYYHYPMYDEALTKLLGIAEMAIKLRCTELGIELVTNQTRQGKTVIIEKKLVQLINELTAIEPAKDIKYNLDWLRRVRNTRMHPKQYGFAGSMVRSPIQWGVVILNKLFMPEATLVSFKVELQSMNAKVAAFKGAALIMEYESKGYLVERCEIREAVKVGNEWLYLLVAYPISINTADNLATHSYLQLFMFFVKRITACNGSLSAIEIASNNRVTVKHSIHPQDIANYDKSRMDWAAAKMENQRVYESSTEMDIGNKESEFLYRYLYIATN